MRPRHVALIAAAAAFALGGAAVLSIPSAPGKSRPPGLHSTRNATAEPTSDEMEEQSSAGGIERWSVKTGADPAAAAIDLTPAAMTAATVETMRALPRPAEMPARSKGDDPERFGPVETSEYSVHGTLIGYKLESDSDYHLVIQGSGPEGGTIIAEIPWAAAIHGSSPWASRITQARKDFDARFGRVTSPGHLRRVHSPVTIEGIGFFDFLHGQTGVAPNGIEIHPVLAIRFGGM